MVPVCDKRFHLYNRFRNFWAEIKRLWNYLFFVANNVLTQPCRHFPYKYLVNVKSINYRKNT